MCAVSVIYDTFNQLPDSYFTLPRIEKFRDLVADAKKFDIEANQPDCEDEEKAKLLARIAELEVQLKNTTK